MINISYHKIWSKKLSSGHNGHTGKYYRVTSLSILYVTALGLKYYTTHILQDKFCSMLCRNTLIL